MSMTRPPVPTRTPARPDDLDGLLHAFFRAELPDPWPTLKPPDLPAPPRTAGRRPWLGSRLALAATVALCLAGSLSLATVFPSDAPRGSGPDSGPEISEKIKFETKTESGLPVKGQEQHRGNVTIIKVELAPMPGEE